MQWGVAGRCASGLAVPIEIKTDIYFRISGRIDLFEEMFHTLEQGYNMENILYACSVFYHFLGTLRYLKQYRNAVKNDSGEDEEDIVAAAIHFMKEDIEARLTLAELSKRVGYSPTTYFRVSLHDVLFGLCRGKERFESLFIPYDPASPVCLNFKCLRSCLLE